MLFGPVEQIPGLRPATRAELYRRLHRGRDLLSASYAEPCHPALSYWPKSSESKDFTFRLRKRKRERLWMIVSGPQTT